MKISLATIDGLAGVYRGGWIEAMANPYIQRLVVFGFSRCDTKPINVVITYMEKRVLAISIIASVLIIYGCDKEIAKHSTAKVTSDSTNTYELNIDEKQESDGAPVTSSVPSNAKAIIKLRETLFLMENKRAMAWSPDGKTLAFVDDNYLVTYHPNRFLQLPRNKSDDDDSQSPPRWDSIQWRPDGRQLIVYGSSTLIIDLDQWKVIKKVDYPQILWWFGNSLATSKVVEPSESQKKIVRTWTANGVTHKLPPGIQPYQSSLGGRAIMGNDDDYENKWLLIIDPHSGEVVEKRTLMTPGRIDYIGPLAIDWNEKRLLAAYLVDSGGGGTVWAYVSHSDWETGVFYSNQRFFEGAGTPHWLDDRWLCLMLITTEKTTTSDGFKHTYDLPRIALYDAETGKLRTVYINDQMVDIAATRDQVAILEQFGTEQQIVITKWLKTKNGEIITTKDEADEKDNRQYMRNGIVLKKERGKLSH